MESNIKEKLNEVSGVLDKLSDTYNEISTDIFLDNVTSDDVRKAVTVCHKTRDVSRHLHTIVSSSYLELTSWLRNMEIKYGTTAKYSNMDDRVSELDLAMDNIHELLVTALPTHDSVPDDEEELESFLVEFAQALWDMSSYTEDAIEELRNVSSVAVL